MTEINQKILDMIRQKRPIEEISKAVNLSHRQIYIRVSLLENKGYCVGRKYNSNGEITYTFANDNSYHFNNSFELLNEQKNLKIMAISDQHIGNIKSDEEAINTIYDYCIKNGIHVIINCGDILDGTFSHTKTTIDPEEQIDYLINAYPFDKSIFTLYTPGDHDKSLLGCNISLSAALNRRRHDICQISKRSSNCQTDTININGNNIMVSHKSSIYEEKKATAVKLHLIGHKHTAKTLLNINESNLATPRIIVPPLSRMSIPGEINIPRAIELTIYMDNDFQFRFVEKKDLLILNDKAINTGETIINYKNEDLDIFQLNYDIKNNDDDKNNLNNSNKNFVDDTPNTPKTFKDSEEKKVGELNDEQKQLVNDFFGSGKSSKKLENMIKGARKGKQKWQ